ncbi:hypothetical protein NFI96_027537 [Prochilodus magdalenae]|nr:hypothetical protein NFI96_027537 [Prochilodus magdalenae]
MRNIFDYRRFLKFARVCEVNNENHICSRDKEVDDLYDMFHMRHSLHRKAYQHKAVNIIEFMITEALVKADPHILIEGSNGETCRMSEAIDDMEAYTKLTDHIFEQILYSTKPELSKAKDILQNIICRRLYKCLGQTTPKTPIEASQKELMKYSEEVARAKPSSTDVDLKPDDFIVSVVNLNYGRKDKNPINDVHFYTKKDPETPIKINKTQVSKMLPDRFAEQLIRVYCKKTDEKNLEAAKKYFVQWCITRDFSKPVDGDITAPELTPLKAEWDNTDDGERKERARGARAELFKRMPQDN